MITGTFYLDDAYVTGPVSQVWTRPVGDALREAAAAVRAARSAGQVGLDPAIPAGLRHSYAVAYRTSVNLSRRESDALSRRRIR